MIDVRRRKLVGKSDGLHVVFEALGAFVVQYLKEWFKFGIGKVLVEFCEGLGEIAFATGLDGFCKNCVLIVVVENHDAIDAILDRKSVDW